MTGHFSPKFRPKLGDKIVASARIVKTGEVIEGRRILRGFTPHRTLWKPQIENIEGIFIGYRTLAEGETDWDGDPEVDGGVVFFSTRRFEAWLIVTDPRRNSIYVLPEDVLGVNQHFPGDYRYFKAKGAGDSGYGCIRIVTRNGSQAATPEMIQHHYFDNGWIEISYSEFVELENATERSL